MILAQGLQADDIDRQSQERHGTRQCNMTA
jgi:hypothetical protein